MEDPPERLDVPRIRSIRLNCWERPLRAIIETKFGIIRVRWIEIDGKRKWVAKGPPEAVEEGSLSVEFIEGLCENIH